MTTATMIKLDRHDVAKNAWESAYGAHYLVISPDGSTAVTWADNSRQWDPWRDDDYVARIPAVFPEGSGSEWELAVDMLNDAGDPWTDEDEEGTDFAGAVDKAEQRHPDTWAEHKAAVTDWTLAEWLSAINGNPNDLHITHPWGSTGEWDEQAIDCPFHFEWA